VGFVAGQTRAATLDLVMTGVRDLRPRPMAEADEP
jgi:hypothetical protein